jgi:hypothetical protein
MKTLNHERPSTTCGTQTWKGEAPSLIKSLIVIRVVNEKENEDTEKTILKKEKKTSIEEASAWIRKYFSVASELRGDFSYKNKAKRERTLISKPIHAINQEEAETAKIELIIKENLNKIFQGRIRIKRRTRSIVGIWAQKLY